MVSAALNKNFPLEAKWHSDLLDLCYAYLAYKTTPADSPKWRAAREKWTDLLNTMRVSAAGFELAAREKERTKSK